MSGDDKVEAVTFNTGSVKWFNLVKGFGFITRDDPQEDIFVHQSAIKSKGYRTLKEGEKVQFQVVNTEKGKIAALVTSPDGGYVRRKRRVQKGARKFTTLCYNCNKSGHRMKKCPYKKRTLRTCHECGANSHLIRNCPRLMEKNG
ncbi:uncharacterized protein [Montipora capricornis]|uniref:uncharacterized protein n=1 Tax=Montipora foliosa TaxID=591990 RepID=UPI0035F1BAAA